MTEESPDSTRKCAEGEREAPTRVTLSGQEKRLKISWFQDGKCRSGRGRGGQEESGSFPERSAA